MVTDGSHRQFTRNILAVYREATAEQIDAGLGWYDFAYTEVERVVFYAPRPTTVSRAVAALAHLSPRVRWRRNLELLAVLLSYGVRPRDALRRSWGKAVLALDPGLPLLSGFTGVARKTRAFAEAILGDPHAVPVDIWAARAAGAEERLIKSQRGYVAVAESYRRAAKIAGVEPRQIQATTWIVTRGDSR